MIRAAVVILVWAALGLGAVVRAQDPNWSLTYATPMLVNPAMVGLQEGNYRFGMAYRWRRAFSGVQENINYPTSIMTADMRIVNRLMRGGAGLLISTDKTPGLRTTQFQLAYSYEAPLGVRVRYDHLRVGFQGGIISKSLNTDDLIFEDQYNGIGGFSGTTNEDVQKYTLIVPDVNMGILWYRTQKIRGNPEIMPYAGVSFQHINRPRMGFVVRESERTSMRYTFQLGARFTTRSAFEFNANTVVAFQNNALQATINAFTRVVLFENGVLFGRHKASVLGGVVWRTSDAVNIYTGIEFEKYMMLGMAYDFYYSRNKTDPFTNNVFGGMQLMFTYLIGHKRFREPSLPFPFF